MKIIITENHLRTIIKEFDSTIHSTKRMGLRFANQNTYDVVAFPKTPRLPKMTIGKYNIPEDVRTTVERIFNKITKPEYTLTEDLALVLQLYEFPIKLEYITLYGNPQEQQKYKRIFEDKQDYNIYLQTRPDEKGRVSHGKFLVCIVRGEIISTAFLLRDQTSTFERLKKDMLQKHGGIDDVIYVADPMTQLDNYINKPQAPPEQPQLTDRERRLQAYNERNKKNLRKR